MNSTTHIVVGGLTSGLAVAYCVANQVVSFDLSGYEIYPIVMAAAGAAGGLAPDVDMARSKSGAFFRTVMRFVLGCSALLVLLITFLPQTGIDFIDRYADVGRTVDKKLPIILAVFCIILLFVVEKSKHRGFTHTPIALIMVTLPLIYILFTGTVFSGVNIVVSAQIGFALGWFSHLVIDTFNYPGTPWLWPLTGNHFNIMRIDSGTGEETAFLVVSVILFAVGYALIIF